MLPAISEGTDVSELDEPVTSLWYMSDVSPALRERLAAELPTGVEILDERTADRGSTRKALLRLGPSAIHRMSFPVMHELRGEYSALFYVLKNQLELARTRAALNELEAALRAQAEELAEQECKKLRLLVARRWKVIG